jgi:hypothetical protein
MTTAAMKIPRALYLTVTTALAGAVLAACVPVNNVPAIVDTKPAVTIPLGAQRDDVLALLGPATRGPRVDAYSELVEYIYVYPFPAVSAQSKVARGQARTEVADRLYLFFDRGGVLRRMGTRVDHYYHSFVTAPADSVTIAARAIDVEGRQIPMYPGIFVPPTPPAPPPPADG